MDELVIVDAGSERSFSRPRPRRFAPRRRRPAFSLREGRASTEIRHREISYRVILAVADGLAAGAVLALLLLIFPAESQFNVAMLVSLPFVVVVSKLFGLYDRDELVLNKSTLDEAPTLLEVSGLFALVVWLLHDGFGPAGSQRARGHASSGSRRSLRCSSCAVSPARCAGRTSPTERCLVVGDRQAIDAVARKLSTSRVRAEVIAGVPVSERQPTLKQDGFRGWSAEHDVHRVIIAPVSTDAGGHARADPLAKSVGVRVSLLPRLLEVVGSSVEFDHVDGLTMLGVRRFGPDALLAPAQARVRPRRLDARCCSPSRRSWRDRARDPARLARPGAVPADAHRPRRRALRDPQVPHDGRDAEARKDDLRAPQRDRGPVQDRRRSADHPRRRASCAGRRSTSCRSCSTSGAAR